MEAKLSVNGYACYRPVYSGWITQTEQQDCVVPDTLPDVASIAYTSGSVLIRSKDVVDGQVRMEANLPARVSCVGEDGSMFCLDVNVPFYVSAEDAAIQEGSVCAVRLTLRHLESRLLNPRKLSVRAEISAGLRCFLYENVQTFGAPEEAEGGIQTLEAEATVTAECCVTEKTFVLTDEVELPSEKETPTELIAQSAEVLTQEIKSVGSKLIVRGSVRSALLYRVASEHVERFEFSSSFSQVVETQTETGEVTTEVLPLVSGMYYELTPGTDGRSVSMELHLVLQLICSEAQTVRYLADAYSNAFPIELETQGLTMRCVRRELLLRETSRAELDTASAVSSVISCDVTPLECEVDGGAVRALFRAVLCWRSGETICSAERTVTQRLEAPLDEGETLLVHEIAVQDCAATPSSGGAEIRISFEVRAHVVCTEEVEAITAIRYQEDAPLDLDDRPTLVMMKVRPEASLWQLAKENCSTVEAICKLNALEEGAIPEDQFLLIPKAL